MATKVKKIAVGETEWKVRILDEDGNVWSRAAGPMDASLDHSFDAHWAP